MSRVLLVGLLCALQLSHAAYTLREGKRPHSAIDRLPFHTVADMRQIPQDISYYAKQIIPIPRREQLRYDRHYNKRYFSPWKMRRMNEPAEDLTWQIRMVHKRKIYDSRGRQIPEKAWQWWITNSNLEKMDSVKGRAISIRHSNLRAFPTDTPAYRDPWKSTEGFPFDYNQNSELHLNTPLYISHYSRDRKWAFVHAGHAFGWVKFADIALTDRDFRERFQTGRYAISIRDNLILYRDGKKQSLIKLGTLFPMSSNGKLLMIAEKNSRSYAVIKKLKKPANSLVAPKPLAFTPDNISAVAQQFYNEPYGWGGIHYTRDCSATTRDFFGCFGIYLDRNSAKQAQVGKPISIKDIQDKAQKKKAILKYAKPFRSLLYVPGHIALYLGSYRGEPVIMHTYWGIRLKNWDKYTLARTIITTTEPGREHPQIRERSKLINTLQTIVNF